MGLPCDKYTESQYCLSGARYRGGMEISQAFGLNVGTCRFAVTREYPSESPVRTRVPMRSTGAERLAVAMQFMKWKWGEGADMPGSCPEMT